MSRLLQRRRVSDSYGLPFSHLDVNDLSSATQIETLHHPALVPPEVFDHRLGDTLGDIT